MECEPTYLSRMRLACAALLLAFTLCFAVGCTTENPDASQADAPTSITGSDEVEKTTVSEDPAGEEAAPGTDAPNADAIEAPTLPEGSSFSVTFFDVGQGDAALVSCDGSYMLIDGGPPEASSLLYSYLVHNDVAHLDYVVATHEDTDHTGGLPGALRAATAGRAFCSVTQADQDSFNDTVAQLATHGVTFEVPHAGDTFTLGSATVSVVGPVAAGDDANSNSLMLRIDYGDTSFLFTGDATEDEERASVDAGFDLDCDVLKVAHHGSAGSSCYAFLRAAMPTYAVISVGSGNPYGHPTDEALSRLRDCGAAVFRTDLQGDVVATSDGETVSVAPQKNETADTLIAPGAAAASAALEATGYIGNANSHKFHLPTCRTLPAEKNRVYFATRDEAVSAGYAPCKNCNP